VTVSILGLARQRRWLGWLGLTTLFAVVCVGLAQWQWQRRVETVAKIRVVAENWDAPPVPLSEVVPGAGEMDPEREWQPVEVSGEYLLDEQLLVRTRPLNGRPGFEVLTPLLLDDGRVLIVDRGWLPVGSAQDSPDVIPSPPQGRVDVLVRLKRGEPELRGRSAPEGQIATVHLPDVAQRVEAGEVVTGAYGLLDSETPAPATRPVAATRPAPDEGPHLSYTFQWYVFALLGFVGYGWSLRTEQRRIVSEASGEPIPQRARRRPSDSDEEDALMDASA
jgi:cytochrome oxidase assembly protein ShyY1